MIKKLKLTNFRQFKKYECDLDNDLVIIHADNTKGKSTIIEAIYLITNQSSPFTSKLEELISYSSGEEYFRIEILHQHEEDLTHEMALYQDLKQKQFIKDGHKTTRKKFTEQMASTIFSPEQIETLMFSSQKRREYLNHLISKMDPEYEEQVNLLGKILRQRNAYLKKLAKRFYESGSIDLEDRQLLYWSEVFAKASAKVSFARQHFLAQLKNNDFFIQFEPSIEPNDQADQEKLINDHLQSLVQNLRRDVATGHTTTGAHRDDWSIHSDKDIKKFGSRGEKRMAISRMIFRNQELLAQQLDFYPTLLLDDISSELDINNTEKILRDSIKKGQQVIVSTISLEGFPKDLLKVATIINL